MKRDLDRLVREILTKVEENIPLGVREAVPDYVQQLKQGFPLDHFEQLVRVIKARGLELKYDPATQRLAIRKP